MQLLCLKTVNCNVACSILILNKFKSAAVHPKAVILLLLNIWCVAPIVSWGSVLSACFYDAVIVPFLIYQSSF